MENSRTCYICNVNVHRASYVKHLRSKKHLENKKQKVLKIPEWLIEEEQAPLKRKKQKEYSPKPLEQIAGEHIKLNDKELAKKMNNPYYFTDENLKIGFEKSRKS